MQILLANAKIMNSHSDVAPTTVPMFLEQARAIAAEMAQMDVDMLAQALGCNHSIAVENWERYRAFDVAQPMPAIMAYYGQAYKHLKAATLSGDDLQWAASHLWITCFLYGLLRPGDAIVPYRMEHSVKLAATGDVPLDRWWHDKLTQVLIDSVRADDGVLIHLSTAEYENLFDWKRVKSEVTVIQPQFYVLTQQGRLKMQAVWAKACRGAMVRHIVQHRLTSPDELTQFAHEGFDYSPTHSTPLKPVFIR